MNRRTALIAVLLLVMLAAGCAPGNERWASGVNKAGFWAGLWHGLIVLVTFVVSWFTNQVGIYEPHNVGFGYNIGYVIGLLISLGGCARGVTRRRRKTKVVYRKPDPDRLARGLHAGVKAAFADKAPADVDWEELEHRIEERIRKELSDWDKEE